MANIELDKVLQAAATHKVCGVVAQHGVGVCNRTGKVLGQLDDGKMVLYLDSDQQFMRPGARVGENPWSVISCSQTR